MEIAVFVTVLLLERRLPSLQWYYDWRLISLPRSASIKTFYHNEGLYVIKISIANQRKSKKYYMNIFKIFI